MSCFVTITDAPPNGGTRTLRNELSMQVPWDVPLKGGSTRTEPTVPFGRNKIRTRACPGCQLEPLQPLALAAATPTALLAALRSKGTSSVAVMGAAEGEAAGVTRRAGPGEEEGCGPVFESAGAGSSTWLSAEEVGALELALSPAVVLGSDGETLAVAAEGSVAAELVVDRSGGVCGEGRA